MSGCDVAIIGMACRFPGAPSPDAFWEVLREGRETVRFATEDELLAAGADPARLAVPGHVRAVQAIPGVDRFDAGHFGIGDDEAEILDPQHRHFLECALAALEDAGCDPRAYPGEIGVFGGAGMNTYLPGNLADRYAEASALGRYRLMLANDKDFLTTRVSYKLGLRGPSVAVNTACSTSLVAVHLACLSLLAGECGIALAGAVHLRMPQDEGHVHQQGMIFSPDGHCRAFDAEARGTVIGSGTGVVVLKPLDDAVADGDTVHAVIKGTAINNDGALKAGFTAPSVERQAAVIEEAQRVAGCPPGTIGYVEAHGTGTPLGDPVEVAALNRAFGSGPGAGDGGVTVLGSVKTNIGHLDAAAGMAGLIKTALMLRHRTLVPSLHFRAPNPDIDFSAGPFRVGTTCTPWPGGAGPRRAGVSSFGIGGTNAHVVLEEPPAPPPAPQPRGGEVLLLSARTPRALERATGDLARYLRRHPGLDLTSVAYTLTMGRAHHAHRRAVVCGGVAEAALTLALLDPDRVRSGEREESPPRFAYVLTGTGPFPGAGELYREAAAFRAVVDACAAAFGTDPRAVLEREDAARFVVPYALARTCRAWGVRPAAVVGRGPARLAAGCLAGVFPPAAVPALATGRAAGAVTCAEPGIPVDPGSGWLRPDEAVSPDTWTRTETVEDDRQAVEALLKDAGLVALSFDCDGGRTATEVLLDAVGRAWAAGAEVDWTHWYGPVGRRVPLPTYPYERRRHWVEPPLRHPGPSERPGPGAGGPSADARRRVEEAAPAERSAILQQILREQVGGLLEADDGRLPGPDENLHHLGADSLVLIDVVATLGTTLGRTLAASFGDPPTIRGLADRVAAAWSTP
ncbi:type I polyketide synthase [Streptomyces griseocarneus]|uniref:type I polyketide synthase n=1 Tax=Streptomyces griseocarneus TaxID=51201 RepID=UPI00167EC525|nr:type I polyketide synthase [Streptomyces griseocarneus]MBZ6476176.1 type I polyketide synthase [Streptomyces griseocarneus]GHG63572.1 hypothetical protein GCM10018779_33280 [Streptomyces griseocarneus]